MAETAAELAAALAEIRREALERVTAELNGRLPLLAEPAPRFGDIRFSIGKAVRERAETAGVPPSLSGNLG